MKINLTLLNVFLVCIFLSGCSDPKSIVIPTDHTKWDDEFSTKVSSLNNEDKELLNAYLDLLKKEQAPLKVGITVGDAIESQKKIQLSILNAKNLELENKDTLEKIKSNFKDPESVQFKELTLSKKNDTEGKLHTIACGSVNAKNSFGGYNGFRKFIFYNDTLATENSAEDIVSVSSNLLRSPFEALQQVERMQISLEMSKENLALISAKSKKEQDFTNLLEKYKKYDFIYEERQILISQELFIRKNNNHNRLDDLMKESWFTRIEKRYCLNS